MIDNKKKQERDEFHCAIWHILGNIENLLV